MAKLIIKRERQYADWLRAYEIRVDGERVASIRRGEMIAVDLKPGPREITATIDWCRSHPVWLEASGEGLHVLEVGSNVRGPRLLVVTLYISIWKDRYLYLRELDPDDALWFE